MEGLLKQTMQSKVAFFVPTLLGGGAELVTVKLIQEFARHNISVDLILTTAVGPYLQDVPPTVRLIDLKTNHMAGSILGLVRFFESEKPACFISALLPANVMAIAAHWYARSSARLIISEHANYDQIIRHLWKRTGRLSVPLMRLLYRRPDVIVAVSHGVADSLVKRLGIARENIKVVYNPVVDEGIQEKSSEDVDHAWFLPGAPPVILGVGRLIKQKDFRTLIEAFSLLRKRRQVRLMILGEGGEREALNQLIEQLDLSNDVEMPGFVANPFKYMRRAKMFVLSSVFEGLGNVLIEAMACGTPVISTDCPSGPAEILQGGHWGRLVDVGDVSGMAEAITAVLEQEQYPDVAKRAADFGVKVAFEKYLELALAAKPREICSGGGSESAAVKPVL